MDSILTEVVSAGAPHQHASWRKIWTGQGGELSILHFRRGKDVFYPPHKLSEYTLVVCLAGVIEVKQFNRTEIIGPGESLFMNLGVEHSMALAAGNDAACEVMSASVGPDLMVALTKSLKLPGTAGQDYPVLLGKIRSSLLGNCAREISNEMNQKAAGHEVIIETMAIRLLVEAFRAWPRQRIQVARLDSVQRLKKREFVRAFDFMLECRKEDFRLQNLCGFLGMSIPRFTRLFLASTQQTPASFYNRMLLRQACTLLRNPALSVKEIGLNLGFKTSSHFTASFRREYALSPQEYRHGPATAMRPTVLGEAVQETCMTESLRFDSCRLVACS